MKELNISIGRSNYSQKNNEIDPHNVCGPTNFIQALEYAGWQWDNSIFPEYSQPEDKLTKFTRTNKDVLEYYEKHYLNMYNNWINESRKIAQEQDKEPWQVACINSYPPNEVHDVMSYAVNLFMGYKPDDCILKRPVTNFKNYFLEEEVIQNLIKGLPVITSVDPFKKGQGHYVTIVGYTTSSSDVKAVDKYKIKEYIVDNTYGVFDFVNKKYLNISGDDEHIERNQFLNIIKPVSHFFTAGAACCC